MKISHAIITILLILGISLNIQAEPLTLDEVLEGSCRVSISKNIGSGTCIDKEGSNYIFLTNGHVVENSKTAYVELFRGGYKSYKIPATVIKTFWQDRTDKDFALLTVDEKYVSQCPPRIIPLVPLDYEASTGYVYSAGCPNGRWLCAWEGQIEEKQATRMIFTPPPVGGQSGGGLLVNIKDSNGELHTRVGSVITFRIGDEGVFSDRRDMNGFELAKGAALPISTLYKLLGYHKTAYQLTTFPEDYKPTKIGVCTHCKRSTENHALGSDNKYYCVHISDGNIAWYPVPGVTIVRWPERGKIIPLPNKPDTPEDGNPFGKDLINILPPRLDIEETPLVPSPEKEECDKIKDSLQNRIDELETELENVNSLSGQKDKSLLEKDKSEETLLAEKEKLQELIDLKEDDINAAEAKLNNTSTELSVVQTEKSTLEKLVERLTGTVTTNAQETEKAKKQRTWLGWLSGGLGVGLLSMFVRMYWTGRGREKVTEHVDNLQDRVDNKLQNYIGQDSIDQIHDRVDNLQDYLLDAIDVAVEKKTTDKTVEEPDEEPDEEEDAHKYNPEEKISEIPGNCDDKSDQTTYNKRRRRKKKRHPKPVVSDQPVSFHINNTNTNTTETHQIDESYIKEFFRHKEKDGESVKDWAFYGLLYKEAIEKLEEEKLYYKGKTRLQGQKITADRINNWVRQKFMERITKREIFSKDKLYTEAMLGFLYKEAVGELATGTFNVLGHQNTAVAIHDWVNKEFLRRINVRI